jgi:hypothetical protein
MIKWLHHLFNPHCPHCFEERICQSCETLKTVNAQLRIDNDRLLNKLLEPKSEFPVVNERSESEPIKPRFVPWGVRKQMLEAEDRERAKLLREAPKPEPIEELEKELINAEQVREAGN